MKGSSEYYYIIRIHTNFRPPFVSSCLLSITPLPLNDISCLMEWLYQKIELFISDVLFNCQLANKVLFQHVPIGYIPLKVLQI